MRLLRVYALAASSWSGAHPWALIAVLVLTGLAVYSEGPVMQTALADVAGKTSMEMLFGLYFTIGAIMGAPWALVLGTLVDVYGFPGGLCGHGRFTDRRGPLYSARALTARTSGCSHALNGFWNVPGSRAGLFPSRASWWDKRAVDRLCHREDWNVT